MTQTAAMLDTHPVAPDRDRLTACIEACLACAATCTACADACLSEDDVAALRVCVRTNLDCADQCDTTGRILSRHTGHDPALTRAVLEACATACRICADECARHGKTGVCAQACRRCEQACRDLLATLR